MHHALTQSMLSMHYCRDLSETGQIGLSLNPPFYFKEIYITTIIFFRAKHTALLVVAAVLVSVSYHLLAYLLLLVLHKVVITGFHAFRVPYPLLTALQGRVLDL